MNSVRFTKAHACGNDFLVVEAALCDTEELRQWALQLCARHTGVGADGVEFLEWSHDRSGRIRLFNADGSIAEISGNGTRCVAAYLAHQSKLTTGDTVTLETDAGARTSCIARADGRRFEMKAGMGVPLVKKRTVRLADGTSVDGAEVSTGNPHFVIFVEDSTFNICGRSWQEVGREICFHPDFPHQTNVEFVHPRSSREIEIRIFERGVGPTTSSGTGTSAAAAATIAYRRGDSHLLVHAPGGAQTVDWSGEGAELLLAGPAELIAEGVAYLA